jgi:hypothetical protein
MGRVCERPDDRRERCGFFQLRLMVYHHQNHVGTHRWHDACMRTVCSITSCWALLKIDHELLSRYSDHGSMALHSIVLPGMDCKTVRISIFTNRDRGGHRGACLCRSMLEDWGDGCSHVLHTLTANKSYPASMLLKPST